MAGNEALPPSEDLRLAALIGLVQSAPYPIVTVDASGAVQWANPAAQALLDEAGASGWSAVLPQELPELVRECLEGGPGSARRNAGADEDWTLIVAPAPHQAVALIRRPTVSDEGLDQLRHLSSIGELAAGIAHEINTPMQYIGDNVAFLRDSFESFLRLGEARTKALSVLRDMGVNCPELEEFERVLEAEEIDYLIEESRTAIEQTREGIGRVISIARAIKEFSHVSADERAQADLNRAIETTLTVARNELKYVADVVTELGAIPPVNCVVSQIHQVLLNLLVNAAHAVGGRVDRSQGERGTIWVRTKVDGGAVVIEIQDTGTGIPEHVRPRIFERFFTTKGRGQGTGQGLAIAKRVVEEVHGGTLTFDTRMGEGTTFVVRLPIGGYGEGA